MKNTTQDALQIFNAGVASVMPVNLMQQHLRADRNHIQIGNKSYHRENINRVFVIAAGKAASAMSVHAELELGDWITAGICVTKYGHGLPLNKIKLLEASHPLPDEKSLLAGKEIEMLLQGVTENDVILVLLSGGASALIEQLPEDCPLHDVQQTVNELIRCGAGIQEINAVRKHISTIKGGGLAKMAFPAQIHTLVLSDVVGDHLDVIASGPTVPDTTTFEDAAAILQQYKIWESLTSPISEHINKGLRHEIDETPKACDAIFTNCFTTIIGSNTIALHEAEKEACILGYHTSIFEENCVDNTEQLARTMVQQLIEKKNEYQLPACLLAGGETTLQVTGTGKGGRNQHFVLCALDELFTLHNAGHEFAVTILSAGTDGTDGPTDATGAVAEFNYYLNQINIQDQVQQSLSQFDAYHFFEKTSGLIKTGPTQTNVMDIMVLIISQ